MMSAVPETKLSDYRSRLYGGYVSAFKGHRAADAELPGFRRQFHIYDHLLRPVLAGGRPESALEIGCGPGSFLYWARERGWPAVEGVDLSAEQIAVARELGLQAQNVSFQQHLEGKREAYDLIVGLDLIEHLTRDEVFQFLDACSAALRPGGKLFLTTPNGAGLRPGPVAHGDLTHETIFTPQTVRAVLQLTGYQHIQIREIAPLPTSLFSRLRGLLWRVARGYALLLDMIEKGATASEGVYSRVMAIEAQKTTL
jgi:2-polyprenyl-3-methyl-5-hydroxy-6-metoxy-1,4-benzoquinol methylase